MTIKQEQKTKELLSEAYYLYKGKLCLYAHSKIRNYGAADDLVQNTFLKTWMYLVNGGKIKTMRAFLYRVLNNLIVDEYRKHKTVSLDILLEKGIEPTADESEAKKTVDVLDGETAFMFMEKLPTTYKSVLCMKYKENMSNQEISQKTGLSKNNIAVQLHRGLQKLKVLYLI